jgi:hypothetical protein
MKSLTINIHSFVDLITNSSTEIFISARENSSQAIINLIDSLLLLGGGKYRTSDLFDVRNTVSMDCYDITDHKEEIKESGLNVLKNIPYDINSAEGKLILKLLEDRNYDHGPSISLLVTIKPSVTSGEIDESAAAIAAQILTSLSNLFHIDGWAG